MFLWQLLADDHFLNKLLIYHYKLALVKLSYKS